ncbi:Secretory carrier-associated membrane protein 5 [Chytridiales sp. JEL 0842]|nr:Secretory carrier-associated membrane protein 5 [Chytridiales sp. JEL 0842]
MRIIPIAIDIILIATLLASVRRVGNFDVRVDKIQNVILRYTLIQLLFVGDAMLDFIISIISQHLSWLFQSRPVTPPPPATTSQQILSGGMAAAAGLASTASALVGALSGGSSGSVSGTAEGVRAKVGSSRETSPVRSRAAPGTELNKRKVSGTGTADMSYSNPFNDELEANPFENADQIASHSRHQSSQPWQTPSYTPPKPFTTAPPNRSSENLSHREPPPPPTGGLRASNIASREAEIERREAELRHREAKLVEREAKLSDLKPPNWPPFKPLVYHDIDADIPEGAGVKIDRSINFFLFFFNYGFHVAFSALLAVGIPGWGGAGVIYTLAQMGTNLGSAVMCAISSAILIFEVVYGLWQIKAVSGYYRSKGMTADQAREQALEGVASSKIGRDLAGAALKSTLAPDASRR